MKVVTEKLKFIDAYPDKAGKVAQRLKQKKDEIPFIRKSYISETVPSEKTKLGKKTVTAIISTNSKDRDGEVLDPAGIVKDNYEKNKIVLWGHSYKDPNHIIGKNLWIEPTKDGSGIVAKTQFLNNQFADDIYKLYTEDIEGTGPVLKGWSVGFIPLEWKDGDTKDKEAPKRTYTKWELLEYSAVPIPSNPSALTLAYQKGIVTSEDLRKDLEITIEPEEKDIEIEDFQTEPELVDDMIAKMDIEDSAEDAEISIDKAVSTNAESDKDIEIEEDVVTKPETTEDYHRIPVDTGDHSDHRIRTITISAKQGIKALFCGTCKKVITYLFDVSKWSMAEAKKWVKEHKAVLDRLEKVLANREDVPFMVDGIDELTEEEATEEATGEEIWVAFDIAEEDEMDVFSAVQLEDAEDVDKLIDPEATELKIEPVEEGKPTSLNELVWSKLESIEERLAEQKEGRVLSTRNRKLIGDAINAMADAIDVLDKLYVATEPPERGEREIELEIEKGKKEIEEEERDDTVELLKKVLQDGGLKQIVDEGVRLGIAKARGKVE